MRTTPLIDLHREHHARLVDFAGWEMPIMYSGIVDEHNYTRQHCTLFDVSHMGRIVFRGPDALRFLDRLCTRNLASSEPGMCRYSHMCRADAGILDDVIVSRADDHFLVVCNASNREKLLAWWQQQRIGHDVEIIDRTFETAMVAIQGPQAAAILARVLPVTIDLAGLRNYRFLRGQVFGMEYFIARSGYTGEDGFEIILPAAAALSAARLLLGQSEDLGNPIRPAGLGARDTLRLEAGMPLYGHELSEDWDTLTAGQSWAVDFAKDFIGRDALLRIRDEGPARIVAGLTLPGKRIARQGASVLAGGENVGIITSGTQSPTLGRNIAMALLRRDLATPGTAVEIDIRGRTEPASVVPLPFYKRAKA